MIIIQLDSEQLASLIKSSVRNVLDEQTLDDKSEKMDFLSISEASKFLNLAPQTIYGFTSNRTIPFIKRGKKLYFRKSDLENWLIEGRKKTSDELGAAITKSLADKNGKINLSPKNRQINQG